MIHEPVMLREVLEALQPAKDAVYVDGTFGGGGYARAILDKADCRLIALDRDVSAAARASEMVAKYGRRFTFHQSCFGEVRDVLQAQGISQIDGLVLDLGVSSFQLDEAKRGFSFRFDAPLDMRMDVTSGPTAADIVNGYDERDLADIIYKFGEERKSRQIAARIITTRKEAPIATTFQLADLVRSVVKKSQDGLDPATRTFQAIRIAVNDELGELQKALAAALSLLAEGGRLVVVSFHSLEDALVKSFLRECAGLNTRGSRHLPPQAEEVVKPPFFQTISKKAIRPSEAEIARNPRSRSARLRYGIAGRRL